MISWSEYISSSAELLVPIFAVAIVLAILGASATARATKSSFGTMLLYLSPFAFLGSVAGLIAGASQEAIVGALLTGMLTIIAGLFSFIFAKDSLADLRPILSVAVVLLCASSVIGLSFGRVYRKDWDAYQREHAVWTTRFERVHVPALAAQLRYENCRKNISRRNIAQCENLLTK
jgi:hypothetical protein